MSQLIGEEICSSKSTIPLSVQTKKHWRNIPIIRWEETINLPNSMISGSNLVSIAIDITVTENAFALLLSEDDLLGFQSGSVIIVDPSLCPEEKDYVVAHKNGVATSTLKKYLIYPSPMKLRIKTCASCLSMIKLRNGKKTYNTRTYRFAKAA